MTGPANPFTSSFNLKLRFWKKVQNKEDIFGFLFSSLENSSEDIVVQFGEAGGDGALEEDEFDHSGEEGMYLTYKW